MFKQAQTLKAIRCSPVTLKTYRPVNRKAEIDLVKEMESADIVTVAIGHQATSKLFETWYSLSDLTCDLQSSLAPGSR